MTELRVYYFWPFSPQYVNGRFHKKILLHKIVQAPDGKNHIPVLKG
jgi:hypothetical protein